MNNSGAENEDVDFSLICPQSQNNNRLDFSIHSLLGNSSSETSNIKPQNSQQNNSLIYQQGSFMKGLQKMEKQVSYESTPYNIYEISENQGELTHTIEVKQESTETKTMNNTKGTSRMFERQGEPEVIHLIVDFNEDNEDLNLKQKAKFQNYFALSSEKQGKSLSFHNKQKNISIIKLSPMNLKIKTKSKKSKTRTSQIKTPRSARRDESTKRRDRNVFKTEGSESNLSTSRKKSRFKRDKKKEEKSKTKKETKKQSICEEYYGYNNEWGTLKKSKSKKQVSGEKTRKIIISKKNIKINY